MVEKIFKMMFNPNYRFIVLANKGFYNSMDDETYLCRRYKAIFNRELNLKNPRSFNEKLQWLKLYNRKPEYTMMVDKYLVKDYVANKIGNEYVIKTLDTWDNPNDLHFDALPNRFVLKCNHNSGLGMCICKDKSKLNEKEIKRKLQKGLEQNYFLLGREWPYKNVKRKIIAEEYLEDDVQEELRDYKVLCFNGEPKLIEYHAGRFTNYQTQDYFDKNWEKVNITQENVSGFGPSKMVIPKPQLLSKMLELSAVLAKNIPHVRIDWYIVNGRLYFGEITFFDGSGFDPFDKYDDDLMLGDWISL